MFNYLPHITTHTGKMAGINSISTSVLLNRLCAIRRDKDNYICSHCYAAATLHRYHNLETCLQRNTELLTTRILEDWELPRINAAVFRFEAFGDLNNEIQAINYFNICRVNRHCLFSIWTKNPHFMAKAIDMGYDKPENLIVLYSLCQYDVNEDEFTRIRGIIKKAFPFIDKFFAVYSKKYATDNNIAINCGKRKCIECMLCYSHNDVEIIREIIK